MSLPFELAGTQPLRIHLIGVAGSGMSGIAALLLGLGHRVSGSDKVDTSEVERLVKKGLLFESPHSRACVEGCDLVVYSSAIKPGNPAFDAAVQSDIPVARRAEVLAALLETKEGIVVAGMHGKTTTSAMAAHVLRAAGLKPSHYVGAEIPILGTNAGWDSEGAHLVAEGDESDGTLALYSPSRAIVLNIEPEHLDFYPDLAAIDAVYSRLCAQTRDQVIYCADDAGAARVCGGLAHGVSYGTSNTADFGMRDFRQEAGGSRFIATNRGLAMGEIHLAIPGAHNALNALAVVALACELGVPFEATASAMGKFRGARRRFEKIFESPRHTIVDDYGHHPTEIAATLDTARAAAPGRVMVMFQPHRFTRTKALQNEFGRAFARADHTFVTEIYSAGEPLIPGITGELLVEKINAVRNESATSTPRVGTVHKALANVLRDGDWILSLGAGNIHEAGARLAADLALRDQLLDVMGAGGIRLYEPLSRHTTMRVGGPAQFWAEPETAAGFADLVRHCFDASIPLMVMGRGSNLIVRDGGIPGVVVHLARGEFLAHSVDGSEIHAGVGVKFKQLAAIARNAGLTGFEWMEGIPGNLGGGLRMNAGAMGIQTFDQVVRIRFCDQDGNIFTRTPADLEVRYRNVPMLKTHYALSAVLRGEPSSPDHIEALEAASSTKRKTSQPVAASAGCIFKNPANIPAGRLIEELGLKNLSVGSARVSEVHANFIVNEGRASAADVLALIEKIRAEALSKRGVSLETEVQIVGEDL